MIGRKNPNVIAKPAAGPAAGPTRAVIDDEQRPIGPGALVELQGRPGVVGRVLGPRRSPIRADLIEVSWNQGPDSWRRPPMPDTAHPFDRLVIVDGGPWYGNRRPSPADFRPGDLVARVSTMGKGRVQAPRDRRFVSVSFGNRPPVDVSAADLEIRHPDRGEVVPGEGRPAAVPLPPAVPRPAAVPLPPAVPRAPGVWLGWNPGREIVPVSRPKLADLPGNRPGAFPVFNLPPLPAPTPAAAGGAGGVALAVGAVVGVAGLVRLLKKGRRR